MQHIAGERRSEEVLDGEGTEHIEIPDLEDDTVSAFHNDEQSDGGHNHTLKHDADAELRLDGQGTKASLSTSTFSNSHSQAPSISMQSSHKCTASTSRPPQSTSKQGHLEAFKVKADTCYDAASRFLPLEFPVQTNTNRAFEVFKEGCMDL